MLSSLRLEDFKSFANETVMLAPLTVFVGSNASGKSNALDAIRFLKGAALDLPISDVLLGRRNGGREVWPGIRGGVSETARYGRQQFELETTWRFDEHLLTHRLCCRTEPVPRIEHESLTGHDKSRSRVREAMRSATFLGIRPDVTRDYVPAGTPELGGDGRNLSAIAKELCERSGGKERLVDWMSEVCAPSVRDLDFVETELGDVMLQLVEEDGARVSARSLSDGTLRFLGQLVALLAAEPSSMLVIEDIESGLHPRRLDLLVELLEGTTNERGIQVIATTRSPLVLRALSRPAVESAVLFARVAGRDGSVARRLGDLPHFAEIAGRRGVDQVFASGWLERAL
jgi:predicted ATPase